MDELNRLIQMATEAETLERAAEAAPGALAEPRRPRLAVGGSWQRTVWVSLAGVTGLAACLTVAVVLTRQPTGAPGPIAVEPDRAGPDRGIRIADSTPIPPPAPTSPETVAPPVKIVKAAPDDTQSVVFALFRATDGSYECVQVDEPGWGHDRAMADIGRGELMQVAFRNPCTTLAPQVLVIGVEGRRGTVPTTLGDAQRLAERLRAVPMHHADVSSAAYAALPDLPVGSLVVAENVAIR